MCEKKIEILNNAKIEIQKFISTIDKSFQKETMEHLKTFITNFSNVKEWCISSDYCFDDKTKKNSTIAFSVFPYSDIYYLKDAIKQEIPKDVKDIKSISKRTLKYLKEFPYFFNFVFIINDDYTINYKQIYKNCIEIIKTNNMNNALTNSKYFERLKKYNSSSFRKKLFAHIYIIATLASYIMVLVLRLNSNINKNLWIPDRGDSASAYSEILFDLYKINFDILKNIYNISPQITNGITKEDPKTHKFDFDELIRIPDYYAGTIASFDLKKISINEKHKNMFLDTIVDNNRFALFEFNISQQKTLIKNICINKK